MLKITAAIAMMPSLAMMGCTTTRVTLPPRSATEQMLISEAAGAAALAIQLKLPEGTKAFLDATNFEGVDAKFAISAIRQSLLQQGNALIDDRSSADVVVEVRAGCLSVDNMSRLIGIPNVEVMNFKVVGKNLATQSVSTGVAKFSLFAFDRHTGKLISIVAPVVGYSHRTSNSSQIVSWTNVSQHF